MAHFYASIPTSARRTVPTARGHKSTGIETRAASWAGAVEVYVWHDTETGEDKFRVSQVPHHGKGINRDVASGVIGK